MSIQKHARASEIMTKAKKGVYVRQNKFHNFGQFVEDSIMGQQAEADRRLAKILAMKQKSA